MIKTLTLTRPDDWHVHLRDGAMLRAVLPFTARVFGRAIIMPNLKEPVTTAALAQAYRDRIAAALESDTGFTPLMTLYLTDATDPEDLAQAHAQGIVTAAKLYPANATTNSSFGVSDIGKIVKVLEGMQRIGMPLLVHGEVTDPGIDIFDREAVFIDRVLIKLRRDFPELKIVLEHITTEDAMQYMQDNGGKNLGATITAHHLLISRNALFAGGLRPHNYCLPVVKREKHRLALVKAATSGNKMFFLGTDTAPHSDVAKECACGSAGIFTSPHALALYAQVFDEAARLENLEAFASLNGAAFYGVPPNKDKVTLRKSDKPVDIKPVWVEGQDRITSFVPPAPLFWSVA